ncbi:MAG: DedA family protein [Sphingobacteriales bacterium]|nr:MAG: DedA family protein [Sphingobacteriales bacterium]
MEKGLIQQFIEWIIHNGGIYVLLLIVFAETGLFVGFFLPGDSLLFAAGIYVRELAATFFDTHWSVVMLAVAVASILGSYVGYWFGNKYGARLYQRRDSLLFKKQHLMRAQEFYHQYGKATVLLSKFLPILRTFAPIVAGMVGMNRRSFMVSNVAGSILWVGSMMMGGFFLQTWVLNTFGYSLKDHIEAIAIVIVAVTTIPVLYKMFFGKKKTPVLEVAEDVIEDKLKVNLPDTDDPRNNA